MYLNPITQNMNRPALGVVFKDFRVKVKTWDQI